jgi:hypothetical protein
MIVFVEERKGEEGRGRERKGEEVKRSSRRVQEGRDRIERGG